MTTPNHQDRGAETPLCDKEAGFPDGSGCWKSRENGEYVEIDFARRLEKALSASLSREAELLAALIYIDSQVRGALNNDAPEDAPDILDHVGNIAMQAVKTHASKDMKL